VLGTIQVCFLLQNIQASDVTALTYVAGSASWGN